MGKVNKVNLTFQTCLIPFCIELTLPIAKTF